MGAMCALDALGICTIAPHASLIRSSCRPCPRSLPIHLHDLGCTLGDVLPDGILVWSGHRYTGACAPSSLCSHPAFFFPSLPLFSFLMHCSFPSRHPLPL